MSNKKPSIKQKSNATTTDAKSGPSRPKKTAAPKRAEKARIVAVTDEAVKNPVSVPKSVEKLAAAKVQKPVAKRPVGRPRTVGVSPHLLNEAYKEATDAVKRLTAELKAVNERQDNLESDLRTMKRTVHKLREIIDESNASKEVNTSWLRRLFGGRA